MGITIHIRGQLRNPSCVRELSDEVADYSEVLGWKHQTIDTPPLTGIAITPHPDCETLTLMFDEAGVLRNPILFGDRYDDYVFVKTQFAPIDTHISLCNLLAHLKERYFSSMEVNDEGEYWGTHDRALLESKIGFINSAMDKVADVLESGPVTEAEIIQSLVEAFGLPEDVSLESTPESRHEILTRVNGPQHPMSRQENENWDLPRWLHFWMSWDEHRSPVLAAMRNKQESVDSILLALDEARKVLQQQELDLAILMKHMVEGPDNEVSISEDDEDTHDFPEAEYDLDSDDDDEDDVVPTFEYERERNPPDPYQIAHEWYLNFRAQTRYQPEDPIVRFVASIVPVVCVGIRMAYNWKDMDDMFLAVPSRLSVASEHFGLIARILRLHSDHRFDPVAEEADRVAGLLFYDFG